MNNNIYLDYQFRDNLLRIYDLDYLRNNELTDDDLHWLLDTPSLFYSLIVGLYLDIYHINGLDIKGVFKLITDNINWFNLYQTTKRKQNKAEKILIEIYQNVYSWNYDIAQMYAQQFLNSYGLSIHKYSDK